MILYSKFEVKIHTCCYKYIGSDYEIASESGRLRLSKHLGPLQALCSPHSILFSAHILLLKNMFSACTVDLFLSENFEYIFWQPQGMKFYL